MDRFSTKGATLVLVPAWKLEIEELHEFFEEWIGGTIAASDERIARLEEALADSFGFVTTGGEVLGRAATVDAVRRAHGTRPGLEIRIREPELLYETGGLLIARYEEWQVAGGERTGRVSTVVFELDPHAPNGLAWAQLHETSIA